MAQLQACMPHIKHYTAAIPFFAVMENQEDVDPLSVSDFNS